VQVSGNKDYYEFAFATLSVLPGGDVQVTVEVIGNFDLLAEDKFGVKLYPEEKITCDGGRLDTIFENFFSCDLAILERNFSQPNASGLLDRYNSLWTYPRARRRVLELYLSHVMQQIRSGGKQTTTQYWNGYTALHLAAAVGDIPSAQELLKRDPSLLNARTKGEDTILFGDQGKWGPGKFYSTPKGLTPLHVAVINGHLGMVHYLLDQGANAEIVTGENVHLDGEPFGSCMTALHLAISYGQVEIVRELVQRCPQLLEIPDGFDSFPIHRAVQQGYVNIVAELLRDRRFLDQLALRFCGDTALEWAFGSDSSEVALLILSHMTPQQMKAVDKEEKTILHKAVDLFARPSEDAGSMRIFEYPAIKDLLEIKNKEGYTPLLYALSIEENSYIHKYAQILLDQGASPLAKTKNKETALHLAAQGTDPKSVEILQRITGLDINAQDKYGLTALHYAAEAGNIQIIRKLLEKDGINGCIQDNTKSIVLHYAAQGRNAECITTLLQIPGLDVNAQDEYGLTALHWAARYGDVQVMQKLLGVHGIDENVQDNDGQTALHYATKTSDPECVGVLLTEGRKANLYLKDHENHTALYYAVAKGMKKNAHLLGTALVRTKDGEAEVSSVISQFEGARFPQSDIIRDLQELMPK
jgi:ankyrin repeat protein